MAKSDLLLRIGADASNLKRALKELDKTLSRTGRKLENIGKDLTLRLTAPIAAAGAASVRTFAQFDKLEKGLTAISGSAAEAQRQFGSLLDVVKDTRTTLDLRTAATAALQLQAVGLEARSVENTLKQLSIAATLSGSSSDDVGEVARQLSQAAAKGNILQQELRIILERIPALAGVIKNEFGTVTAEGLREAGVSAQGFIDRLTTAIERNEKFQNVQGGISKALETFGINLQIAGAELGKTISETIGLEQVLNRTSATISKVVEGFASLNPSTKSLILGIAGTAAAIGPLLVGLGAITKLLPLISSGFSSLLAILNPFTIVLGLAAAAFVKYRLEASAAEIAQTKLGQAQKAVNKLVGQEQDKIRALIGTIQDENTTRGEKAQALETLRRISPDYFGNLDIENLKTEDLVRIGREYNSVLAKRLSLQELNARSAVAQERLLEVQKELSKFGTGDVIASALTGNLIGKLSGVSALQKEKRALDAEIEGYRKSVEELLSQRQIVSSGTTSAVPTESGVSSPQREDFAPLQGLGQNAGQSIAVFEELSRKTDIFNAAIAETGRISQEAFSQLTQKDLEGFSSAIADTNNLVSRYGQTMDNLSEKSQIFGESFNLLQEQLTATKTLLNEAIESGASFTEYEFLVEKVQELNLALEDQARILKATAQIAEAYGSAFNAAAQSQVKGFKDVAGAALAAARDVVKAKLLEATASFFADAFAKLGIFGAVLAAGAGAVIGGLFSTVTNKLKIPALAEGGIVNKPTLALIGEGSESEAVLPLSKLNRLVQSGGGQQELVARVEGEDLYFLIQRVGRSIKDIG